MSLIPYFLEDLRAYSFFLFLGMKVLLPLGKKTPIMGFKILFFSNTFIMT